MPVITRKIQIIPQGDKEQRNAIWQTLRGYEDSAFRAANYVATHAFVQEKISEFSYFHDDIKMKLTDRKKDDNGIFNTSSQNTTYRMLSAKYKGKIPSSIYCQINSVVRQTMATDKKDYFTGAKSLRSYKKGMPIPIGKRDLRNLTKDNEDKGNYSFTLFGMDFKTFFGRDLSGNEIIIDRASIGEYSLCDSSIQIKNNKIFLLAVIKFDSVKNDLKEDKVLNAKLGLLHPIEFEVGKNNYTIGNKEEFLHRRLQIQEGLRRCQISQRFNKGGKGRKKKLQATERYELAEKNYVTTRIHQYTAKLVDWCIKMKCGQLVLIEQEQKEEIAKEDEFLLRNWGYYGMKDLLKYKCNINGIKLVVQ